MYPIYALYYISSSASFLPTRYVPKWSTPALVLCTYIQEIRYSAASSTQAHPHTHTDKQAYTSTTHAFAASFFNYIF